MTEAISELVQVEAYDVQINEVAVAAEKRRQAAHEPSGRISASMMGTPTLWNVLKLLGVPSKEFEPYLLRKFARGNQAEQWFVDMLQSTAKQPFVYGQQMEVNYCGGIGFVDVPELVVNEDKTFRVRPHEVKSVTNAKFKRLTKGFVRKGVAATGPDKHHVLQVAFYALALESPDAFLHYIASDDLRVATWHIPDVNVYKPEIDGAITAINQVFIFGELPEFTAKMDWQEKIEYWPYPDFFGLSAKQIEARLEQDYPHAYSKLKGKS